MSLNYFSDELIHKCSNPNCDKQVDESRSHVSLTEDHCDHGSKKFFCNLNCLQRYKENIRHKRAVKNQSVHKSPNGFPFTTA